MALSHKQMGFTQSQAVLSMFQAAQPAASVHTKIKPNPSSTTASVSYHDVGSAIHPSKLEASRSTNRAYAFAKHLDSLDLDDEHVDVKAASYISFVQERFRRM